MIDDEQEFLFWLSAKHSNWKFHSQDLTPWKQGGFKVYTAMTTAYLGMTIHSTAVSSNDKIGKIKAITESLERVGCFSARESAATNTNGFAAHPVEAKAKAFAWNELVERDAFLWHWHSSTPPTRAPAPAAASCLADEEWSFFSLQSLDPDVQVAMAMLRLSQGGVLIGLGGHNTFSQALESAHNEAASMRSLGVGSQPPLSLEQFYGLPEFSPSTQARLALDAHVAKRIVEWVESPVRNLRPMKALSPTVEMRPWPMKDRPPLHLARAHHADLLPIYFGPAPLGLLRNFWSLKDFELNLLPHPFS